MKKDYFGTVYDLSFPSQLASLFKKFSEEGLTKEVSDEFNLLASQDNSKSYGSINIFIGNLILYNIFQDGAVIKVKYGDEYKFLCLRHFDAKRSDNHFRRASKEKASCSVRTAQLHNSPLLKELAEECLMQFDDMNSYKELSLILENSEKEEDGKTIERKLATFFEGTNYSAVNIINAFARRWREGNRVNADEILSALKKIYKPSTISGDQIKNNKIALHKINFIEVMLSGRIEEALPALTKKPNRYEAELEYGLLLLSQVSESPASDQSNRDLAINLIKKVADNAEDLAFFLIKRDAANHLGKIYLEAQDTENAFKYFNIAASLGLIEAKLKLAIFYRDGLSIAPNFTKAVQIYEEVAKFENHEALIILALAFEFGESGHCKVMEEYGNFYKTSSTDNSSALSLKSNEAQLTAKRIAVEEEGIFAKQDLERSTIYWKELLKIIPESEENRPLRKRLNQNLDRVLSKKSRIKKESADKVQKTQIAPEELSNVKRLTKMISNYTKDQCEDNKQALHNAMVTFFLEVIDNKENFSNYELEFSQIASIADGDRGADLSQEARIIIDIKRVFSSSKDARKRSGAKKNLIEQASFIAEKSSDDFTNENDKLFWEKIKEVVDELIEASKQESLLKSQEIIAPSSAASGVIKTTSPTSALTQNKANQAESSSIKIPQVKVEEDQAKPTKTKPKVVEKEEGASELRQLIVNYEKESSDQNKKLLLGLMINFFLEAIKSEPKHFPESIFSQIAAFNGSLPKEDSNLDDLGLVVRIITNIKRALFSQKEERRTEANEYLYNIFFSNALARKGIANYLLYLDENKEDDKSIVDHLFWQEIMNFKKSIEAQQMNDFLKRDPSNPIKSTKDLPEFLRLIFDKLLKDGHQLSLKGSCVNRSANSKRIPVDLDVDIFIQGISTWPNEEIQKFMRENFFCQCSIYRDTKNPKCITVSMKNGLTTVDICVYDEMYRPEPNLTWSNSKDAKRVKFDVNGNAEITYVDGFTMYLSKIKSEMFNPETDFILNPAGRGIILRACLLVATEEIKEGSINKTLEETENLEDILLLLNKELKLHKHTNIKMTEDHIRSFIETHQLYGAPKEKFVDCLNKVVDLAKSKNPKLSIFNSKNPLFPEDFTQRINHLEQAIKNIRKECEPSSLPTLTENAAVRVLESPKQSCTL